MLADVPAGCRSAADNLSAVDTNQSRGTNMSNGRKQFARFMASGAGRSLRVVAGVALIVWGWSNHQTTTGLVVMFVGLVPLLAGVFNVCVIAPIIGVPFAGRTAIDGSGNESAPR